MQLRSGTIILSNELQNNISPRSNSRVHRMILRNMLTNEQHETQNHTKQTTTSDIDLIKQKCRNEIQKRLEQKVNYYINKTDTPFTFINEENVVIKDNVEETFIKTVKTFISFHKKITYEIKYENDIERRIEQMNNLQKLLKYFRDYKPKYVKYTNSDIDKLFKTYNNKKKEVLESMYTEQLKSFQVDITNGLVSNENNYKFLDALINLKIEAMMD